MPGFGREPGSRSLPPLPAPLPVAERGGAFDGNDRDWFGVRSVLLLVVEVVRRPSRWLEGRVTLGEGTAWLLVFDDGAFWSFVAALLLLSLLLLFRNWSIGAAVCESGLCLLSLEWRRRAWQGSGEMEIAIDRTIRFGPSCSARLWIADYSIRDEQTRLYESLLRHLLRGISGSISFVSLTSLLEPRLGAVSRAKDGT